MPDRHMPVRPNLRQLRVQAKDLLREYRQGDPSAAEDFREFHPRYVAGGDAKLADAQLVLARSYTIKSWPRLVLACRVTDAIWRDDSDELRELVTKHPALLHEMARGTKTGNWGPPMSYAANLGRDDMIEMLHELGAVDVLKATARATLQGQVSSARKLFALTGLSRPPADALGGPAYTLSVEGTAILFEFGATVVDDAGKSTAPVDVVLESDSRDPSAKHQILEMYVEHGLELPDTPTMALHRGRIDLLEEHLRRDPRVLTRTFEHEEIYPPELGCHDEVLATQGTPLAGTTLLHMCIDYDEAEIAAWLLDHGADVNKKADVNSDGFGGHTALFATVVSQPAFWINHQGRPQVAPLTELLLDRGADPNVRASIRKQLHPGYGPNPVHEYRDITALSWGRRFHDKRFVSEPAMRLIAARGGLD